MKVVGSITLNPDWDSGPDWEDDLDLSFDVLLT